MCDYSLHSVTTRPAKVGDKLTTRVFNFSTRGFCAPEDVHVAVCVLPGTELSFTDEVRRARPWPWSKYDALEFPDGEVVLLTFLMEGQQATVLQLPAAAVGSKAPQLCLPEARVAVSGIEQGPVSPEMVEWLTL